MIQLKDEFDHMDTGQQAEKSGILRRNYLTLTVHWSVTTFQSKGCRSSSWNQYLFDEDTSL